MKHFKKHIILFVVILILGLSILPLFNRHYAFNGEEYVRETIKFTITGYSYKEIEDEVYLSIEVNGNLSGYTIYENIFREYFESGDIKVGDFVKIHDYCLLDDEGGLTYFKSSNKDILNAFKKKYDIK